MASARLCPQPTNLRPKPAFCYSNLWDPTQILIINDTVDYFNEQRMECAMPHESRRNCRKPCRATHDEESNNKHRQQEKIPFTALQSSFSPLRPFFFLFLDAMRREREERQVRVHVEYTHASYVNNDASFYLPSFLLSLLLSKLAIHVYSQFSLVLPNSSSLAKTCIRT